MTFHGLVKAHIFMDINYNKGTRLIKPTVKYCSLKKHHMIIGNTESLENKLELLHRDAQKDYLRIGKGVVKSIFRPLQPSDFEHAYLPISKAQGEALRKLIMDHNCKTVVEFGTSFGISTLYLADAVSKTNGQVITTEIIESKALKAKENIKDVGLIDYVDFRIGDAMKTLQGLNEPIDFLFLDGWKDLYLPLFQMLEGLFHSGTIIYSDNMDMSGTESFARYLQSKGDVYENRIVDGGKAYLSKLR